MYRLDTFRFFCFANIIPVTVTANALGVRSFSVGKRIFNGFVIAFDLYLVGANAAFIVRTSRTNIVACVNKRIAVSYTHLTLPTKRIVAAFHFFADGTHIFAKCVTVALADESRRTHQMVIPNSHYLINLLRRFVRTAAITILTASGMRNGTTHIPRIVPTPIGVPLFV